MEDTKRLGDTESRDRASLLSKFKNLNTELENFRERIEEESEKKSDALKALSKAQAEIQLWKSKFETEGLGRIDELESGKSKLSARLMEAEETIETLNQKVASTEKTKHRLESELEDLQLEYERVHAAAIITEKRGRNFDKVKYIGISTYKCLIYIPTLINGRLLVNGKPRLMIFVLKLRLAKRSVVTTTVKTSG